MRSHLDKPVANEDGSYGLVFGPEKPEGPEGNWVQTLPGKGWLVTVRLYGPTEDVFNDSWKLSDITRLE